MAVYTDRIPDCKSTGERTIHWQRGCQCERHDGTLEIEDRKTSRTYRVTEFLPDAGWDGRAFEVVKADGTDTYHVLINRNGQDHDCSCAAGIYRRVAQCCHVAAMLAVLQNGWLEDPRDDPRPSPWPYPEQVGEAPF
jgi:hypothetical protein